MDNNINIKNKLEIIGEIVTEPLLNHKSYDEEFYGFDLKVPRLSDKSDLLKCIVSKKICEGYEVGDSVHIFGEFRSYNNYSGTGSRLVLTVFIHTMGYASLEGARSSLNNLELDAFICKKPIFRKTPFGREIADLLLAVNRRFNKSDYIPAICWGRNARYAESLDVGDNVVCTGRVQSREYKKRIDEETSEVRIAYEVSINSIDKKIEEPAEEEQE